MSGVTCVLACIKLGSACVHSVFPHDMLLPCDTHRFRVVRMLRESPFPVAHVVMWPDEEEAQVYAGGLGVYTSEEMEGAPAHAVSICGGDVFGKHAAGCLDRGCHLLPSHAVDTHSCLACGCPLQGRH
jgi:hypothetical protein